MALNTNCRFAFDPHSNVLYDPSTMDRVDVSNLPPGERVVGADLADLEAAHEQIRVQKMQRRRVLVDVCATLTVLVILAAGIAAGLVNRQRIGDYDGGDLDATSIATAGGVVPPPPTNLDILCDVSSVETTAGYQACEAACQPSECCRALDPNNCATKSIENEEICAQYDSCISLSAYNGKEMEDDDGYFDTDTTASGTSGYTNPKGDTVIPEAPVNLSYYCDPRNKQHEASMCEYICQMASCCQSTGGDNCRSDNPERCNGYALCWEANHDYAADTVETPGVIDQHVAELCDRRNMDNEYRRDACREVCSVRSCCFTEESGDADNCYEENPDWCGEFSPCLNLHHTAGVSSSSSNTHGEASQQPQPPQSPSTTASEASGGENGSVKSACSLSNLRTALGQAECQEMCKDRECCFAPESREGTYNCYDEFTFWCDEYRSCQNLVVASPDESTSGGGQQLAQGSPQSSASSSSTPSNPFNVAGNQDEGEEKDVEDGGSDGEIDSPMYTISELIESMCIEEELRTNVEARDDCLDVCVAGACCFLGDDEIISAKRGGCDVDCSDYAGCEFFFDVIEMDELKEPYAEGGAVGNDLINGDSGVDSIGVGGVGGDAAPTSSSSSAATTTTATTNSTSISTTEATTASGGDNTFHTVPPSSSLSSSNSSTPMAAASGQQQDNDGGSSSSTQAQKDTLSSFQENEENSIEEGGVNVACSPPNLETSHGIEACKSLCQARACCFVGGDGVGYVSFGGACYGALESWCDEYFACLALAGVDSNATGGSANIPPSSIETTAVANATKEESKGSEGEASQHDGASSSVQDSEEKSEVNTTGSGGVSSGTTASSPTGTSGTGGVFSAVVVAETNETSAAAESAITVSETAERPSIASSPEAEEGQVAISATSPDSTAAAVHEASEVSAAAVESTTSVAETAEANPTPTGGKSEADEACSPSKLGDARGREECRAVCDERACCFYGGKSRSPLDCVDELSEWCGEYSACWDLIAQGEDHGGEGGATTTVGTEEEHQDEGSAGSANSSAASSSATSAAEATHDGGVPSGGGGATAAPQNPAPVEPEFGSNASAAVSASAAGGADSGNGPPIDTSTRPTFGVQEVDTSSLHTGETAMSPVDVTCTKEKVGTAPGYRACRDVCDERACCFVKGQGNCRFGTNVALCNEYNACWLLYDDGDLNGGR